MNEIDKEIGHDERPFPKKWDEIYGDEERLLSKVLDCLDNKESVHSCTGKFTEEWNKHLDDVSAKSHSDLYLAPEEEQLLSNSENKFAQYLKKEIEFTGLFTDNTRNLFPQTIYTVLRDRATELASTVHSEEIRIYEPMTVNCLSHSGNSSDDNACLNDGLSLELKELNGAVNELSEILMDPKEKQLLKDDQLAWSEYFAAEQLFIDKLHPSADGNVNKKASAEKMRIVEDRMAELYFLSYRVRSEKK